MRVIVKSFGPIRRVLGKAKLELDIPEGATVKHVIQQVVEISNFELKHIIYEDGSISGNLIVMINKKDVDLLPEGLNTHVSENDEIAILPHVQGG